MLAVLLGDDLIIIKTIKYLYSLSILCRLRNVLRVSSKCFPYLVRAGLVETNCVISMLLQYYGLDYVLVRKPSGQSSKSSSHCFHMAKCFHLYKPICKVKQFTKTYSPFEYSMAYFLMRLLLFSKSYLYIPEVMKTGLANLTFCVTFHNFSCLILACLLCCSRLISFFCAAFWLGICVEVDVDMITTSTPPPRHASIFFALTHNSLFNTSESYSKLVRDLSWFRYRFAVYF